MRIRFHSYFYPPCVGGGEVVLARQAQELARRGHEVHVHTSTFANLDLGSRVEAGTRVEEGVFVHRRPALRIPVRNPLEADVVVPAVARDAWQPADVLVCVGYPSPQLDALSLRCRLDGTPLMVQNYVTAAMLDTLLSSRGGAHRHVRAAYWRHWVAPRLAAARWVVADSESAGAALRSRLGLGNVHVAMGMAVDPDEFDAVGPEERAAVRARLGLGEDRIVLAPSRFARQKGADLLVEAMAPLLSPGGPLARGWRLVIPGAVNEPAYAATVRAQAAPLGDRVVFAPDAGLPRPQLVALMTTADVVALPSRGETVGGVVLEGMQAGALAVVSDAVEAARDTYLRDGRNGLLVPAGDVPAWRAAIVRAATTEVSRLRLAGRLSVAQEHTWTARVDAWEAMVEEGTRAHA
ncbi:MAG: D-inositol-3-phosphate glycosyltransferase [Pseudomonadota bacterium]